MSDKEIKILAIESSCDETAAAVVVNGRDVRSNVISSQIALHTLYGGVVPEIASRKHIEKINQVIEQALSDADTTLDDIDAIGVTYGPGLVGALLVGVAEAKAISYAKNIPLVGVHHIEGHISANYIENKDLEPPFLCLVVSGGHTHLVKVLDYGKYEILGRTRDDAAGEAFDKVARAIGLGYPGGPKIEKVSHEGNPHAMEFPRAKIADGPYDFSFSGLKSAVLNYLNGCQMKGISIVQADVAASFQKAVTDVLIGNAMKAIDEFKMDKFAIAGGVASNGVLREGMREACEKKGVQFYHPSPIFCTDNAAMIGVAAYYTWTERWVRSQCCSKFKTWRTLMEKFTAIVLAGGTVKRMHSHIHKQYLTLAGKPVLYYALKAFEESDITDIILVTGADEEAYCKRKIIDKYHIGKVKAIVPGGVERYHSVYAGLCAAEGADYVLIHDGARPLVDGEIIARAVDGACSYSACVAAMPVKDTIKVADADGFSESTPDRSTLRQIQTPQAFRFELIYCAYEKIFAPGADRSHITDDAMVVELMTDTKVKFVEGSYSNIKVTTPEDMVIAEALLYKGEKHVSF